jgi:ferrochelatase
MRRAILFLNLGGPETLDDVKPFLYRLFVDPEIIRVRFSPARKFIAWMISTLREKKSRELYAGIGGGSPIHRLTDEQSSSVEKLLRSQGKDVVVRTAFTCSSPLVEDVVRELSKAGVERFLALPLYPQYSFTTTKGSLDRARDAVKALAPGARLHEVVSWPDQPDFVAAHADLIRREAAQLPGVPEENIRILFSAHSIPENLVTDLGDPYQKEMEKSVKAVIEALHWKGSWELAWQSRLGPVKWLAPSTAQRIEELGKAGQKYLIVVPIAFVTDHIETLSEIDIEFREIAEHAGITHFRRTPGLNAHPSFIKALASVALEQKEFWN